MRKAPRPPPALPPDVQTAFHLISEIQAIQAQGGKTTQKLAILYEDLGDCYRGLRMVGRCVAMYERSLQAAGSGDLRFKLAELLVHILGPAGFSRAQQLVGPTVDGDRTTPTEAMHGRVPWCRLDRRMHSGGAG
jgi:hypothetical protein